MKTKLEKEIHKCKTDFYYFCNKYLKIVDKGGKLILLNPNTAQQKFLYRLESNPWLYILKARQLGLTTMIAAKLFHKCLFTPNHKVAVIAHTRDAAKSIFEIYKRYYINLPKFLKFKTEASNVNELVFFHGGYIKVGSASSSSFRGSTYNSLHLSEFAFYDDITSAIQSVFQTATPNAEIILETTANGINDAMEIWNDSNGFDKLFISWLDGEEYVSNKKKILTKLEKSYIGTHKLDPKKANWFQDTLRGKCLNNFNTFNQEYPITAEVAFITSGQKFFPMSFQVGSKINQLGWKWYKNPQKFRTYIAGVDTASGSPTGDFSTVAILDVTGGEKGEVVATFYDRLSLKDFTQQILIGLKKYNPLVVVESNSYGQAIIENLREDGYVHMYRRTKYDKISNRWSEHLGFATTQQSRPILLSRLHQWVAQQKLSVVCPRLMTEMNHFVYNASGKPEADKGKHDDLVFATGLALVGLEQIADFEEEIQLAQRPSGLREQLEWESNTGKMYGNEKDNFYDGKDSPGVTSPLNSM
tara:strand:+ start:519 stop:2105 length:1587 start_codon:yes stop_codon:yes gene_type:complete